jgi:hypothetical protein
VNGVTIGTTTPLYFKTSSGSGLLQFSLFKEFTAKLWTKFGLASGRSLFAKGLAGGAMMLLFKAYFESGMGAVCHAEVLRSIWPHRHGSQILRSTSG